MIICRIPSFNQLESRDRIVTMLSPSQGKYYNNIIPLGDLISHLSVLKLQLRVRSPYFRQPETDRQEAYSN